MDFLLSLLEIIMVNIVLSGDNAVVIAMASRNLPQEQRKLAILGGAGGAIVLRVGLTLCAVMVLKVPYVQIAGGLLLIWIAVKLLVEDGDGDEVNAHHDIWAAVRTIIVADLVMSLDNTLAIAGAAHGDLVLLVLGLVLSVPIIIFGSQIIVKVMDRLPVIVYIGAGLIAWTAGKMIAEERSVEPLLPVAIDRAMPFIVAAGVVLGCWIFNRRAASSAEKD